MSGRGDDRIEMSPPPNASAGCGSSGALVGGPGFLATSGRPATTFPAEGYQPLATILVEAHDQAAYGKGKDRHADDKPFLDQPIISICRRRGVGFALGQVEKKTDEADGMLKRGDREAAIAELIGAINYLAAAIITIREGRG